MNDERQPERQYLDQEQAKRLYYSDETFKHLVEVLVHIIDRLQLTPGEVRSAATFAAIQAEIRRPRPLCITASDLGMSAEEFYQMIQRQGPGAPLKAPEPPPVSSLRVPCPFDLQQCEAPNCFHKGTAAFDERCATAREQALRIQVQVQREPDEGEGDRR